MSSAAIDAMNREMQQFGWLDYSIFVAMLVVCMLIGVYFGFIEKRRKTMISRGGEPVELNYLVGGRNMSVMPVSMSLIATSISGVSLLGTSTEMYIYGTGFMLSLVTSLVSGLIVHYFVLPVIIDLHLTSLYEYLETRFDRRMRLFGSIVFTLNQIIWIPLVVYVPALAFNQVSGIDIHIITPVICLICIIYTSIGGIRAVVWTDVVQIIIMYGTMSLIVIKGTIDLGGFSTVYDRNNASGRIEWPKFDVDPTIRHTIFSILLGGSFNSAAYNSVNQGFAQRYLSLPNLRSARQSLWIFVIGTAILTLLCLYNGLLIYATYYDCDPLTTKLAKAKDQLVPLLVMDVFRTMPGIAGLFVSGIFSAALSSLSTALNSLSAVVLEDFIKPNFKESLSERQTNIALRGVVVFAGIVCVGLVFVVERLGAVLQLSISLGSITNGPLFAIFLMGLLMPWINAKSVFVGGVSGLLTISWITFRSQSLQASGQILFETKPVTTVGCTYEFLNETTQTISPEMEISKSIYHMSYLFYTAFGCCTTLIVSHLATLIFGRQDPRNLDLNTISPYVRKYILAPQKTQIEMEQKLMRDGDQNTYTEVNKSEI